MNWEKRSYEQGKAETTQVLEQNVPYDIRLFKLLIDARDLMQYMDFNRVERVKPGELSEWGERYLRLMRDSRR